MTLVSTVPPLVNYAFDVAWDLAKTYAPFYIPPKPPGLTVANNKLKITILSPTKTRIAYNEGITNSGEQYTNSAQWKWDFPYGANSGWYWTNVDRRAANGYYHMDSHGYIYWQKENSEQFSLDTSFCIYRNSKAQEC